MRMTYREHSETANMFVSNHVVQEMKTIGIHESLPVGSGPGWKEVASFNVPAHLRQQYQSVFVTMKLKQDVYGVSIEQLRAELLAYCEELATRLPSVYKLSFEHHFKATMTYLSHDRTDIIVQKDVLQRRNAANEQALIIRRAAARKRTFIKQFEQQIHMMCYNEMTHRGRTDHKSMLDNVDARVTRLFIAQYGIDTLVRIALVFPPLAYQMRTYEFLPKTAIQLLEYITNMCK